MQGQGPSKALATPPSRTMHWCETNASFPPRCPSPPCPGVEGKWGCRSWALGGDSLEHARDSLEHARDSFQLLKKPPLPQMPNAPIESNDPPPTAGVEAIRPGKLGSPPLARTLSWLWRPSETTPLPVGAQSGGQKGPCGLKFSLCFCGEDGRRRIGCTDLTIYGCPRAREAWLPSHTRPPHTHRARNAGLPGWLVFLSS